MWPCFSTDYHIPYIIYSFILAVFCPKHGCNLGCTHASCNPKELSELPVRVSLSLPLLASHIPSEISVTVIHRLQQYLQSKQWPRIVGQLQLYQVFLHWGFFWTIVDYVCTAYHTPNHTPTPTPQPHISGTRPLKSSICSAFSETILGHSTWYQGSKSAIYFVTIQSNIFVCVLLNIEVAELSGCYLSETFSSSIINLYRSSRTQNAKSAYTLNTWRLF